MTKIAYVGVAAAMLLASAPVMAQEKAEEPAKAPEATATNEVSEPAADVATQESTATEAADTDAETVADDTAATAPADPVVCKRGKTVRNVNIVAPGSNGRLCEVHYAKPTEGVQDRVLWYANSDKSFCDERANNLMMRLTNAGFSCVNPDGTPVTIEASAPATDSSADTISAPEEDDSPAAIESDHPDNPDEPADAPESSDDPGGDDQQN